MPGPPVEPLSRKCPKNDNYTVSQLYAQAVQWIAAQYIKIKNNKNMKKKIAHITPENDSVSGGIQRQIFKWQPFISDSTDSDVLSNWMCAFWTFLWMSNQYFVLVMRSCWVVHFIRFHYFCYTRFIVLLNLMHFLWIYMDFLYLCGHIWIYLTKYVTSYIVTGSISFQKRF